MKGETETPTRLSTMIVCKIYVDVINEQKCIVTELAKDNVSKNNAFVTDEVDGKYGRAYVYPTTAIAISKEAKELLYWLLDCNNFDNWENNIFLADYTFEMDDYENNIGTFGFRPSNEEGETSRKKIFYINKRPVYVNSQQRWTELMDNMPVYDNEFLKNLDLTEPVEL